MRESVRLVGLYHTHTHTHTYIYIYIYKGKDKVIPLKARCGPEGG